MGWRGIQDQSIYKNKRWATLLLPSRLDHSVVTLFECVLTAFVDKNILIAVACGTCRFINLTQPKQITFYKPVFNEFW